MHEADRVPPVCRGETEPAKLLAVFVVDSDETNLTTPLGR